MSIAHERQGLFFGIGIVFILIKSYNAQIPIQSFRSSNVELRPVSAILNSTSVGNFLCVNQQLVDLPFVISLSKNISNDHLQIFHEELNKTTIQIRIQLRNYIGTFHLYCHLQGQQNQRAIADVIVIAKTGLIQLVERCHVYDTQYIKCIIRAPVIARAIQNGFPEEFEFTEDTDLQSYRTQYEFSINESTDEYLVFKWKPNVDEEFPNGVMMNMKIRLPYFGTSFYRFNMTPIFLTKPEFKLKQLPKYQIRLTSISSPRYCEKSITSTTNITTNQTWVMIESDPDTTIITDLLPNTTYQICMICRQTLNSSYTIQECQEITTRNESGSILRILIPIIIILCLIVIIISGLIYMNFCIIKEVVAEEVVAEGVPPEAFELESRSGDDVSSVARREDTYSPISEANDPSPRGYTLLYEPDRAHPISEANDEPVPDAPLPQEYTLLFKPDRAHRFSISSNYSEA